MASWKEEKLVMPAELVRRSCGIAIDIGASVVKAVYRSKEDEEESKNEAVKVGHLTLMMVSGTHVKDAVAHLASVAQISKSLGENPINTTGLGCTVHGKLLSETLKVKLDNQTEFDCFVRGFHYLAANLTRGDLFEKFEGEAAAKTLAAFQQHLEVFKAVIAEGKTAITGVDVNIMGDPLAMFAAMPTETTLPVAKAEEDLYPCMLAMCGSGFGYMLINADGTFKIFDSSNRGGRSFYGLGTLLTGAKTFEELIELASRGDPKNVDMYSDALFAGCAGAEGEDSMYTKATAAEGVLVYCFGKGVGAKLEDFNKEDLACALLNQYILDMVQTTMLVCAVAGVKRVCFAGSFPTSKQIRGLVTAEWIKRGFFGLMTGQPIVKFDFVKAGPHLGAVGALVSHYEKHSAAGQ